MADVVNEDCGRTLRRSLRPSTTQLFGAALTSEAVDKLGAGLSCSDAHYWPMMSSVCRSVSGDLDD